MTAVERAPQFINCILQVVYPMEEGGVVGRGGLILNKRALRGWLRGERAEQLNLRAELYIL